MSADLDHLVSDPQSALTPTPTPPMHQTASECSLFSEKSDLPLTHLNTPTTAAISKVHELSAKQLQALDDLLIGNTEDFICRRLRIDRSTLYRWKHRHPLFMAELNRRHQEIWSDLATGLRISFARALKAIQFHLNSASDMTQLRAARTLLQMAKAAQLASTTGPTDPRDVLDLLLRQQQPPAPAPTAEATTDIPVTFTDTQRQSLLNQLLEEEDAAQTAADAEAQARRQSRKNRATVAQPTAPSSQPPPGSPPLVAGLPKPEENAQNQSSS